MRAGLVVLLLTCVISWPLQAEEVKNPESQMSSNSLNEAPNQDSTQNKAEYKSGFKQIGHGFGKVGKATGRSIKKGFDKTGHALDKVRVKLKNSFTGENESALRKDESVDEVDLKQADNQNKPKPNNDNSDLLGQ